MNHQYEGFLNDIARLGDAMRHRNEMDGYEERIDRLRSSLAKAYAVRSAVQEQLRRLDPTNPVLVDIDLRERIAAAGNYAFWNHPDPDGTLNFDRPKDVGETFKIPGRD